MNVRILSLFDEDPVEIPKETPEKKKRTPKKEKVAETYEESDENTPEPAAKATKIAAGESGTTKNYYAIGEIAKMFKVRTSHIRFWTIQFALKMRTNRKGDRLYTPENIEQLKLIHHLVKIQGFTIAGAKAKMKELKNTNLEELQKSNIINTLKALRETLLQLRRQI
ncbi:MerR family transcriptional regulator [Rurimicrobium arvi]|uniref:HTH merR-type domain-containing protein n=1 Tax=Rurimicrobium arvi TaxID=2049916 RepID=A0ABP8MJG5_9BACT